MTGKYELTEEGGAFRLTLSGRLTYNDHNEMRDIINFFKKSKSTPVIVDMSGLTFIDSSAIGTLFIMAEELRSFGGTMTIENPQGQVARVLGVAKILDLFLAPHVVSDKAANGPDFSSACGQTSAAKDIVRNLLPRH